MSFHGNCVKFSSCLAIRKKCVSRGSRSCQPSDMQTLALWRDASEEMHRIQIVLFHALTLSEQGLCTCDKCRQRPAANHLSRLGCSFSSCPQGTLTPGFAMSELSRSHAHPKTDELTVCFIGRVIFLCYGYDQTPVPSMLPMAHQQIVLCDATRNCRVPSADYTHIT